jgi:hypothetical protein
MISGKFGHDRSDTPMGSRVMSARGHCIGAILSNLVHHHWAYHAMRAHRGCRRRVVADGLPMSSVSSRAHRGARINSAKRWHAPARAATGCQHSARKPGAPRHCTIDVRRVGEAMLATPGHRSLMRRRARRLWHVRPSMNALPLMARARARWCQSGGESAKEPVVAFMLGRNPLVCVEGQNVGGVLAEMISQSSVPVLRNRCGIALVK